MAMNTTKNFIFRLIGESRGLDEMNRKSKALDLNMGKLAIRAAAVIPVWTLLRASLFALPRAIAATTREWIDFQSEMARVATVSRTSSAGLEILESNIRRVAASSKASFKDAASAVYALGSAGLTATQQLQGFEHVLNVAIGTGGNLEQTSKLISGAFNVFGKSMKNATNEADKFKKIADTIAYTYSTQQVELAEISTAMGYVASVGSLVDISFEELTATLGVLNTGMLKGSKAGTSLLNAFVQLARKSDRLSELGINIDTSKPLDFLDVMEQLNKTFGDTELSLEGVQKIMSTFGIRGGRAVALLLNNWSFFQKSLADTNTKAEDFAEIMKRIQEDNIPGLGKKIANTFKSIGMDLLDNFETPFMDMLERIQSALDRFQKQEELRGARGRTTKMEATANALPAYGTAIGAFGASRLFKDAYGIQRMQATAPQFREDAFNAKGMGIIKAEGLYGSARIKAIQSQRPDYFDEGNKNLLTDKQVLAGTKNEINKATSGFTRMNRVIGSVAKTALMAYAGLELVRGLLNQFAPDALGTKAFNEGLNAVLATITKFIALAFENLYYFGLGLKDFLEDLPDSQIIKKLNNIALALNTFVENLGKIAGKTPEETKSVLGEGAKYLGEKVFEATPGLSSAFNGITWAIKLFAKDMIEVGKDISDTKIEADKKYSSFLGANRGLFDRVALIGEADESKGKIAEIRKQIAAEDTENIQNSAGFIQFSTALDTLDKKLADGALTLDEYGDNTLKVMDDMFARIDELAKDPAFLKNAGFLDPKTVVKAVSEGGPEAFKKAVEEAGAIFKTNILETKKLLALYTALKNKDGDTREAIKKGAQSQAILNLKGDSQYKLNIGLQTFQRELETIYSNANTKFMSLFNFSDDVIALEELKTKLADFNTEHKKVLETRGQELTISDLLYQNEEKMIQLASGQADSVQKQILALQKEGLAVVQKQFEVMKKMGSYVKTGFKDAFQSIFEGERDFSTLASNFGAALKTAWQDQFSDIFSDVAVNLTGLDSAFGGIMSSFGDVLKGATNPIAEAHLDGITRGAKLIVEAHQIGIKGGSATALTGSSKGGIIGQAINKFTGPTSAIGKFLNSSPFGGGSKSKTYFPAGSYDSQFRNTDLSGYGGGTFDSQLNNYDGISVAQQEGAFAAQLKQYQKTPGMKENKGTTYGQMAGLALQSAMTGYSTYQAAGGSEGGAMAGIAGLMSGLGGLGLGVAGMTGAGGAALLGAAAGPVGWIGLGLAAGGMLLGAFNQPEEPAYRKEEVREQTTQIASRIDITNNALEWVNRNLVELKQELTYIMRESFYFSEKSEAERFSIDSRRGVLGG